MLVSTVPKNRLSAIELARLYCLRWQIELQFKRDKSIGGLDQLPNRCQKNIEAWILAKLLLSQLAQRIASLSSPEPEPACSPLSTQAGSSSSQSPLPRLDDLWEYSALAWSLLRFAFLHIDWRNLHLFVQRFRSRLAHIKRRDVSRQVDDFLAFLRGRPRVSVFG